MKSEQFAGAVPVVETDVLEETQLDAVWSVILFNDSVHTFDDVIHQLVIATACSASHAERLAWLVHTQGMTRVYDGEFEVCFRVQSILGEIQLITELRG